MPQALAADETCRRFRAVSNFRPRSAWISCCLRQHVLRDGTSYQELGGEYFDQLHPERARNRLLRRFERLGWDVPITPRTPATPDTQLFHNVLEGLDGRETAVHVPVARSRRKISDLPF